MLKVFFLSMAWIIMVQCRLLPAEEIQQVLGPLDIAGKHLGMLGPRITKTVQFHSQGWITDFSASLLDEAKAVSKNRETFCQVSLYSPEDGIRLFTLDQRRMRVLLPDGFGLPLRPDVLYPMSGMLQSEKASPFRNYYFGIRMNFVEKSGAMPLKDLTPLAYPILASDQGSAPPIVGTRYSWWLPPGKHSYKRNFNMPLSSTVHYVDIHVSRYSTKVLLTEVASGKIVYSASPTEDKAGNLLEIPSYSSTEGFPVKMGDEYSFSIVYDNPKNENFPAEGTVVIYIHPIH